MATPTMPQKIREALDNLWVEETHLGYSICGLDDLEAAILEVEGMREAWHQAWRERNKEALAALTEARAAAEREADRLRHGVPIEGDFVCPDSLRADAAEAEAKRLDEALDAMTGHADDYWKRIAVLEAEAKRLREALERPDMDAQIDLIDKHADRAMGYLRMDGDTVPTDTDTRAVIWNEMSALLGDYARAALSSPGDGHE